MVIINEIFGHSIVYQENLRVLVKDQSNNPVDGVNLIVTNGNYVLTGVTNLNGWYDFKIDVNQSLDLDITYLPSGLAGGVVNVTHSGIEGSLWVANITALPEAEIGFQCDLKTFNESGESLGLDGNGNPIFSSSENTVLKAIFTATQGVPDPNDQLCIISQYSADGTDDEDLFEYPPTDLTVVLNGNALEYSLIITPEILAQRGDNVAARIINL